MRIGIVDYLLRASDSLLLPIAREMGLDAIELSVERFGDPASILFDPIRGDDLPHLSRVTGIALSSFFAMQFLTDNLLDADPLRRRSALVAVKGLAERAQQLGVPVVVLPLLAASEVVGEREEVALAELVTVLGNWSEQHDVAFALKTSLHARVANVYLNHLDPRRVGYSFDPGYLVALGRDPLTEWSQVKERVHHIHLSDRTMAGIPRDLGQGDVPLAPLVDAILTSQYAGTLVLHTPTGKEPRESARRNRVYLERLLLSLRAHHAA